MKGPLASAEDRFWARVDRSNGPDACWPWTGSRDSDGYGLGRFETRTTRRVHRIALEQRLGRHLRRGRLALHHCDNPPCCNPAHLYEGTPQDNVRDMIARGRGLVGDHNPARRHPPRGERNGRATITEADVVAIRSRLACGEQGASIARSLGLGLGIVYNIAHGRTWRHVDLTEPAA